MGRLINLREGWKWGQCDRDGDGCGDGGGLVAKLVDNERMNE